MKYLRQVCELSKLLEFLLGILLAGGMVVLVELQRNKGLHAVTLFSDLDIKGWNCMECSLSKNGH